MEWEFVKRHAAYLTPAILIMLAFTAFPHALPADWHYHIDWPHQDVYPPLAPFITTWFWLQFNGSVGLECVLLFIVIPYLILRHITKTDSIPLAYLYLSGIPWVLAWGGFFAQAVEQVWMLLNVLSPVFWPFTLVLGQFTHRESDGAWILSVVVWFIYQKWRDGHENKL